MDFLAALNDRGVLAFQVRKVFFQVGLKALPRGFRQVRAVPRQIRVEFKRLAAFEQRAQTRKVEAVRNQPFAQFAHVSAARRRFQHD